MLKRRIIKGIILIIICFMVYLGVSQECEAEEGIQTNYIGTYREDAFNNAHEHGGIALQYINYFNYENSNQENMFFCNKLGYPPILINKLGDTTTIGSPDTSQASTRNKTDRINPQIAYAMSIGILPENLEGGDRRSWTFLQELIWDANPDVGEGDGDGILAPNSMYTDEIQANLPSEVKRFRKVYEEIFTPTVKAGKPLFKLENKKASLFIDQNDGTYIYGPFQLKVNAPNASQDAIDNLVREILEQGSEDYIDYNSEDFDDSEAYIENFYKLHKSIDENFINNGISNPDNNKLRYDINGTSLDTNLYTTILVDETGKPIDIPSLDKSDSSRNNFFIKFYPAKDGAIINLGKAEDGAEFFNLKVKYDSYINYKEHIQACAFFTKGIIGYLDAVPSEDGNLIPPDAGGANFMDKNIKITWQRVDGGRQHPEPILWKSYLEGITAPTNVAVYDNANGSFIPDAAWHRGINDGVSWAEPRDDEGNSQPQPRYYYLNNYYSDLDCVGFSTYMGNDGNIDGSNITVPFTFAGTSYVEITKFMEAKKNNFALPLKQNMVLDGFHGVIKETATATFRSDHWVCEDEEPEYDDQGNQTNVGAKTAFHDSGYDYTTTKVITRYRYVDADPQYIIDHADKIVTGYPSAGKMPANEEDIVDNDSWPSDHSDGPYDQYRNFRRDDPSWTLDTIYGGDANYYSENTSVQYGFRYKAANDGWKYANEFETYDGRTTLAAAVINVDPRHNTHTWEETSGKSVGEYDIWIPRDIEKFQGDFMEDMLRGGSADAEDYYRIVMDEYLGMKTSMQSFVSFEGDDEADIFKYGEKIAIEKVALPYLKIAEAFGGNVWKESTGVKGLIEESVDGRYDMDTEEGFQGIKVDLYECKINYKEPQQNKTISDQDISSGTYITSTFTDADGDYRFYGKIAENTPLINPLRKYYVKFVYNGQIYAQTLYNVDINTLHNEVTDKNYGTYKDYTSKATDTNRMGFNKRFETIYSDSNNYTYTGNRYAGCEGTLNQNYTYTGRAYGLKHVVKEALNDPNFPSNLDTFEEQYNLFIKNNTHADYITTKTEYAYKHAPGNRLTMPIEEGTGEIIASDIDKDWEYRAKLPDEDVAPNPVDYNYSGLSESVKRYLQDCMIEASVPYKTPDLTVFGNPLGMTDIGDQPKVFPEEATFCLKGNDRIVLDKYTKWELKLTAGQFEDPDHHWETEIPPEIAKYIEGIDFPEGTIITVFEREGEEYINIDLGGQSGKSQEIKVASLNDNYSLDFEGSEIKVAGEPYENVQPRNDAGEGDPVTPGPNKYTVWALQWQKTVFEQIRQIEESYHPPEEHYINIYNHQFDLRYCWNFGVYQKTFNTVSLQKDLYKATMVVNGKKEVYNYGQKIPNEDGGKYNIDIPNEIENDTERYDYFGIVDLHKPLDGGSPYTREVRKSDYLFDENVAYGDGEYSKNIKAYLTYKIQIKNTSPYTVRINEIADYYDADNLEFDGILVGDRYEIAEHTQYVDNQKTISKYTYASDRDDILGHDPTKEYIGVYRTSTYSNGGPTSEHFVINNDGPDNDGQPYHLETLYIRGNDQVGIPSIAPDGISYELKHNQLATIFITFKVKNNTIDRGITTFANQIKLDDISRNFAEKIPTIGKNNFAEINSYSSYYTSQMPEDVKGIPTEYYKPYGTGKIKYGKGKAIYLNMANREVGVETNPDICIAGMVDVYSNPGSFSEKDVEVVYSENREFKWMQFKDNSYRKITRPEGMPKLNKGDAAEELLPTVEPDMDKAPAIRIILSDAQIRKISGYVFEDERNVNSDGSPIGDGIRDDNETKVNGVTVQLVELIQDVDYDGTFTGQYIGEKVWDECEYTGLSDVKYQLKVGSENQGVQYYSGKGMEYPNLGTKFILNSTSNLAEIYTNPADVQEAADYGKYCFTGLPSGDFFVRFIYGDTNRTALTNGTDNNDSIHAENDKGVKETAKVNELLLSLDGSIGIGKNVKSYNGQDYKSTVYQRDLKSNNQVDQNAISYNMKGNNQVKGYIDTEKQDYASTKNYEANEANALRSKEELYNSQIIYYSGQPINNSSTNGNYLKPSQNLKNTNPRTDIQNDYSAMWRYDRVATSDKPRLSDANDLYGYRQRGIDYAKGYTTGVSENEKTLLNYRAEVLSSFERVTSQEYSDGTPNAKAQLAMINELKDNTYMVAQSGIISMNNEYEGLNDNDPNIGSGNVDGLTKLHMVTGEKQHVNHAEDVDLGLVERPRAQVKLTKDVANIEVKLADGQTLFNSNTRMKNLIFDDHSEHEINYNGNILEKVRVTLQTQSKSEIVQATMDDEIMNGSTINITYHLQVENVGEIDYANKDFYFYGKKSGNMEPVRTRVVRVIDYVPNDVSYDSSKQNEDAHWDVYKPSEVINSRIIETAYRNNDVIGINNDAEYTAANAEFYDKVNRDYVTRTYAKEVQTYNTLVVTKDMNDNLLPTLYTKKNPSVEGHNIDKTTLILTTSITASGNSEDLTYNNLAEVIETSNQYGRRMQYSISGNQEMANQDINDGGGDRSEPQKHHEYSSSKIVQPREIDADSAQQVQILPPTGSPEYRNRLLTIITTTIAVIIVLVGAIIIKKKVYEK